MDIFPARRTQTHTFMSFTMILCRNSGRLVLRSRFLDTKEML